MAASRTSRVTWKASTPSCRDVKPEDKLTLSVTFWDDLQILCSLLEPFEEATNVIQRDNATMADVNAQFGLVVKAIKNNLAITDAVKK